MHRVARIVSQRAQLACIVLVFGIAFGALWQQPVQHMGSVSAADPPATDPTTDPRNRFIKRLDGTGMAPPQVGQPVRLKIPAISVDAAMEQVGQTPDGAMDVPKDFSNTAWYDLGARPGEPGNAVIDGHVDSTRGKAVFWDLHKLARGDRITVVGDDGVERQFAVTGTESYARPDVPLARIFGPITGVHLNLITCDQSSAFDPRIRSYDNDLVVYAEAVL